VTEVLKLESMFAAEAWCDCDLKEKGAAQMDGIYMYGSINQAEIDSRND
jgi:hypothetical protein